MSFSLDIDNFVSDTVERTEKIVRGTALGLFSKVITATPIDTGLLRGNWQTSVRVPMRTTTTKKDKTKLGSPSIKLSKAEIAKMQLGDVVFMTNNMPYAEAIEYGHSDQARNPDGMVRIALAEYQAEINRQIRKVDK